MRALCAFSQEPILAAAEPADPAFYAPQLEAAVAAGGSVPSGPAPEPLPKDPSVAAAREADKAAAEAMAARQVGSSGSWKGVMRVIYYFWGGPGRTALIYGVAGESLLV